MTKFTVSFRILKFSSWLFLSATSAVAVEPGATGCDNAERYGVTEKDKIDVRVSILSKVIKPAKDDIKSIEVKDKTVPADSFLPKVVSKLNSSFKERNFKFFSETIKDEAGKKNALGLTLIISQICWESSREVRGVAGFYTDDGSWENFAVSLKKKRDFWNIEKYKSIGMN